MEDVKLEIIESQIKEWAQKNLGRDFEFREHQFENIVKILSNILNGVPDPEHPGYILPTQIIEAPTGSGKSIIILISAGVLADYYELKSYVLCSDLALFSQYENFIKQNNLNMGAAKGITGNYVCKKHNCMVMDAPCKMHKTPYRALKIFNGTEFECSLNCKYMQARKKAAEAKVSVLTYSLFMYQMNICEGGKKTDEYEDYFGVYEPAAFKRRPIIFCDECHKIPTIVQLFISPYLCPKNDFPIYRSIINYVFEKSQKFNFDEYFEKLKEKYDALKESKNAYDSYYNFKGYLGLLKTVKKCTDIIEKIFNGKDYDELTDYEKFIISQSNHFKNLMCYLNDFHDAIEMTSPEYLVKRCGEDGITLNCVYESILVQNYLFAHSDFQILTSATIGEQKPFEENIGSENTILSKIPSTFNFDKSPILYISGEKMSLNKINKSLPIQIERLKKIFDIHSNEKGIIHTSSYALAKKLYKMLPEEYKERILLYKNTNEKERIISEYKKSSNKILIGPSHIEGIDLYDELCRFNIILKIPFPSMGDAYVARKMRLYKKWYNAHTSNSVIQALGRGIRHTNDYCACYILDGCFGRLRKLTKTQYSPEFMGRLMEIKGCDFDKLYNTNKQELAEVA